jgi:hypothetical protein
MAKSEVIFEYDFGDCWEHRIVPLGTADASLKQRMRIPETQDFFCFEGQSHASEENCDGLGRPRCI